MPTKLPLRDGPDGMEYFIPWLCLFPKSIGLGPSSRFNNGVNAPQFSDDDLSLMYIIL